MSRSYARLDPPANVLERPVILGYDPETICITLYSKDQGQTATYNLGEWRDAWYTLRKLKCPVELATLSISCARGFAAAALNVAENRAYSLDTTKFDIVTGKIFPKDKDEDRNWCVFPEDDDEDSGEPFISGFVKPPPKLSGIRVR